MFIHQLLTTIISAGKSLVHDQQKLLELSLVVASIFAHILEARQNIWSKILAFPIAFINIYVYSVRQLYGKVVYSIIFIFFNIYAYIRWKGNLRLKPVEVNKTSYSMLLSIIGLSTLGWLGWNFIAGTYFNLALPSISRYADGYYLSFGFMDKWLMAHKKLEKWMISTSRYIALSIACYYSGTSSKILIINYFMLSCISIYGQIKWYASYKSIKV